MLIHKEAGVVHYETVVVKEIEYTSAQIGPPIESAQDNDESHQEYSQIRFDFDIELFNEETIDIRGIDVTKFRPAFSLDSHLSKKAPKIRRLESIAGLKLDLEDVNTGHHVTKESVILSKPRHILRLQIRVPKHRVDLSSNNYPGFVLILGLRIANGSSINLTVKIPSYGSSKKVKITTPFFRKTSWAITIVLVFCLSWMILRIFGADAPIYKELSLNSAYVASISAAIIAYFCFPRLENIKGIKRLFAYLQYPELYFDRIVVTMMRSNVVIIALVLLIIFVLNGYRAFKRLEIPEQKISELKLVDISNAENIKKAFRDCGYHPYHDKNRDLLADDSPAPSTPTFFEKIIDFYQNPDYTRKNTRKPKYIYRRDVGETCLALEQRISGKYFCLAYLKEADHFHNLQWEWINFSHQGKKENFKELYSDHLQILSGNEIGNEDSIDYSNLHKIYSISKNKIEGWNIEINKMKCNPPVLSLHLSRDHLINYR